MGISCRMVFGKELSGQISFAAAEFYAKDVLKAGRPAFLPTPLLPLSLQSPRFGYFGFGSTAFCRCHFYFYGFLTNLLSAFRRLALLPLFCYSISHSAALPISLLVPWRFPSPWTWDAFRSRWTSGGHFFLGRICNTGWTEDKTSCLDTPDGEKVPLPTQ